jgi:THO complex subunit 2
LAWELLLCYLLFCLSYKQNKFNLLREQTEGYTKLTTEIAADVGPPHDPATGKSIESKTNLELRAQNTWRKVLGLIGYFDLDPNRALDIVIDVFAVHVTNHYAFFLALLRASPWCRTVESNDTQRDAQEEPIQSSRVSEPVVAPEVHMLETSDQEGDAITEVENMGVLDVADSTSKYAGRGIDEILRIAEGSLQSTLDSRSPVCAQVLGFKFEHYQVDALLILFFHILFLK